MILLAMSTALKVLALCALSACFMLAVLFVTICVMEWRSRQPITPEEQKSLKRYIEDYLTNADDNTLR